jgi:hypothetical protein
MQTKKGAGKMAPEGKQVIWVIGRKSTKAAQKITMRSMRFFAIDSRFFSFGPPAVLNQNRDRIN